MFGYWVKDPENYGIADFDAEGNVKHVEEKPKQPKSNYAITGLYFYDNAVVDIAAGLQPSPRGELEITDVNKTYLKQNSLRLEKMGRGYAWLDTGTHDSLLEAGNYVRTLQKRQGLQSGCPEEIAYDQGWIDRAQLKALAGIYAKTEYGDNLLRLAER